MSVLVNAALAALAGVIGSLLGAAVAGQKLALPIGILTGLLGYFASGALVPQQSRVKSSSSAVSEWEEEDKAKKAKKAKKAAAEARKKEEAAAAREAEEQAKKEEKKAAKKAAEAKAKKAAAKQAAVAAPVDSDSDEDSEEDAAPKSKSAIKKAKKAAKEAAAKKEAEAAAKAAAKKGKKGAAAEPVAAASATKTAAKPALTPAQEKAAAKAAAAAAAADLEGWETIEATKPTKSQLAKAAVSSPVPSGKAKKTESIPSSERLLTEELIIPVAKHSLIIGTQGKTLATLQTGSGAQIDMPKRDSASSKITITGTPAQVSAAKNAIQSLADRGFSSITHPGRLSDEISVDPDSIGLILGAKGKFLHEVQEATGTKINLPEKGSTTNKKVTIVGEKDGVKAAKAALRALLQDGFSSITHPGWIKTEVDFPSDKFGVLIGPKGNTIKSIQKETSTRINLPAKDSKSSTVSICGLPADVAKVRARFDKMLEPPAPLPEPDEKDLATDDAWGQEHTARGEDALWA